MFGRPADGMFADGVSRIAYSDADVDGRRYVMGLMRAARLQPRIDPAGNIFATRAGGDATLPPILFGSHIDSVPSGGNFDGDLGSLSALAAIEALDAAGIRSRWSSGRTRKASPSDAASRAAASPPATSPPPISTKCGMACAAPTRSVGSAATPIASG